MKNSDYGLCDQRKHVKRRKNRAPNSPAVEDTELLIVIENILLVKNNLKQLNAKPETPAV